MLAADPASQGEVLLGDRVGKGCEIGRAIAKPMPQRFVLAQQPLLGGVIDFCGARLGADAYKNMAIERPAAPWFLRQVNNVILKGVNLKGERARIGRIAEQ